MLIMVLMTVNYKAFAGTGDDMMLAEGSAPGYDTRMVQFVATMNTDPKEQEQYAAAYTTEQLNEMQERTAAADAPEGSINAASPGSIEGEAARTAVDTDLFQASAVTASQGANPMRYYSSKMQSFGYDPVPPLSTMMDQFDPDRQIGTLTKNQINFVIFTIEERSERQGVCLRY